MISVAQKSLILYVIFAEFLRCLVIRISLDFDINVFSVMKSAVYDEAFLHKFISTKTASPIISSLMNKLQTCANAVTLQPFSRNTETFLLDFSLYCENFFAILLYYHYLYLFIKPSRDYFKRIFCEMCKMLKTVSTTTTNSLI